MNKLIYLKSRVEQIKVNEKKNRKKFLSRNWIVEKNNEQKIFNLANIQYKALKSFYKRNDWKFTKTIFTQSPPHILIKMSKY